MAKRKHVDELSTTPVKRSKTQRAPDPPRGPSISVRRSARALVAGTKPRSSTTESNPPVKSSPKHEATPQTPVAKKISKAVIKDEGDDDNAFQSEGITAASKAITKVKLEDDKEGSNNANSPAKPVKQKRKTKEEKEREAMPIAARTKGIRHYIGAHVSIAKGVHNAVHNAVHIGGNSFALFLKSQRKWESPPMQEEHATLFHGFCKEHEYLQNDHVLPHGSYLVNLASVNPEQRQKSLASFLDDMKRCARLGIKLYNFHPGNTNGAPREEACARIAEAIDQAHAHVPEVIPVLETMASSRDGSNVIGGRFEDLAMIIAAVKNKSRVGCCIDTCHIFAAGYDIASEDGFRRTMQEFDKIVGRKYLRAWHLNDSKAPHGSGRDLHANIGWGFIGLRGFWNVMNMNIWGDGEGVHGVPMVLETPIDESSFETTTNQKGETVRKGVEDKGVWAREIKLLESLIGMDPTSAEFTSKAEALSERGREQREKMIRSVETKKEKDALKQSRAKVGKSRRKKTSSDKVEQSENEGSSLSELSEEN